MDSVAADTPPELFLSGTPRGRRSLSASSSSSSSSFSSSFSSSTATPFASPSPRHFAVPFSWERFPGIPKSPKVTAATASAGGKLPLPPLSFRSQSDLSSRYHRYRSHGRLCPHSDDPFAIALRNCAEGLSATAGDEDHEMRDTRRRKGEIAGRFGLGLGLERFHVSCKAASSVATADATVRVHRAGSGRSAVELVRN